MNPGMIFMVASLIFGVAVIVGADIWALKDPPETELRRSLSKAIDDLLEADDGTRDPGSNSPHNNDRPT
jgi:hypothetical protein